MALRECIFADEDYSDRGCRVIGTTIEIINCPGDAAPGLLHSSQNDARIYPEISG